MIRLLIFNKRGYRPNSALQAIFVAFLGICKINLQNFVCNFSIISLDLNLDIDLCKYAPQHSEE